MYIYYFLDTHEVSPIAFRRLSSASELCMAALKRYDSVIADSDGELMVTYESATEQIIIRNSSSGRLMQELLTEMEESGIYPFTVV